MEQEATHIHTQGKNKKIINKLVDNILDNLQV